jgi:hypothetical protein
MFKTCSLLAGSFVLVAALAALSPVAAAATDPRFTFTTVADTSTPIPGGAGRFADFAGDWANTDPVAPSLDHGAAVFFGHGAGDGPNSPYGVFRWDNGSLSRVADNTLSIPGRAERMLGFGTPVVSGGRTAFEAQSTIGRGVLVSGADGLHTVAVPGMPAPGGLGTFTDAARPVVRGDDVWFFGAYRAGPSSGGEGIFLSHDGTLTAVAHTGTPLPGREGETFTYFAPPRGDRGEVAFFGSGAASTHGIYRTVGGTLVRVVDSAVTPGPGPVYFPDNTAIDHDGRDTSFTAQRPTENGYSLWIDRDGTITRIAASGEPTPGGAGSFDLSPTRVTSSVDAGHVAFTAGTDSNGRPAIFTDLGGPLNRLVGMGDSLFGKTVADLRISQDGLSGNGIAFAVVFSDHSSGVYLATVPEPGIPALATFALCFKLLTRRRRPGE